MHNNGNTQDPAELHPEKWPGFGRTLFAYVHFATI